MAVQNTPTHTLALARSIAARTRRERALRVGARASAVGGLVGGALLVVSTQTPEWHRAAPFVAGGVLLCATAVGLAIGWRRPVSLASSAGRADAIENLHDRLTSAVELAEPGSRASRTGPSAPFAELVIAEAEERAPGVRPASIVPIGLGRAWFVGIVACAVGAAGWATIPVRTPEATPAFATARTSPEDRRNASDALDETIESIGSAAPEGPAADPEPDALDPLADQLTDQLTDIRDRLERGELDADDALAKAADELEAAAQRTEPNPTEDAARSIAEAAKDLDGEISDESTELADSLAAGDLSRARDAARNLFDRLDEMPPEARTRIAEDLAKLAETLDERPDFDGPDSLRDPETDPATDPASADRELVDALRDQLGDVRDPDRVAEALEQEGLDPASARDLADRIAAREAEREARDNTRRDLEQLRDALDAASRDVAETTPRPEEAPEEASAPPTDRPAEQPTEQPADPENRPDPARDTPASEQSQTDEPKPDADRDGQPKPDANGEPKPDANGEPEPDPSGTRGEETTQKSPSETTGSNEGTPKTEPGEGGPERTTEQPAQRPADQPADQPDDQPDASPSEQRDANGPIKRDGEDGADGGAKGAERTDDTAEDGAEPTKNRGTDPNATPKPDGSTPEGGPSADENAQPGQVEPGRGEPKENKPGEGKSGKGQPGQPGQPGQADPSGNEPTISEPGTGRPSDGPTDQPAGTGDQGQPSDATSDQGNGADGPGNPGEGRERLRRELDRLADRQNQRTKDAQRARELRDQAQRLLERASPEEREEMLDAARRMAQDAQQSRTPGPLNEQSPIDRPRYDAEAETVDARDSNAQAGADRVLSEWFNPDGTAPEGVGRTPRSAETLRQAADSAERAVEQQRVPPRYRRLVRDVFKRMKDRADSAAPAPAELGEDAGKNGGGNNDSP